MYSIYYHVCNVLNILPLSRVFEEINGFRSEDELVGLNPEAPFGFGIMGLLYYGFILAKPFFFLKVWLVIYQTICHDE